MNDVVGYVEPPHYSKFNFLHKELNVLLTGMPDAIFVRRGGAYVIADYKTARFTDAQDALRPAYEVQLNVYGVIAQRLRMPDVSGLALIYLEPCTEPAGGCANRCRDGGFDLAFTGHVVPIRLAPNRIEDLLRQARDLYGLSLPPAGLKDCRNCVLVDSLAGFATNRTRRKAARGVAND